MKANKIIMPIALTILLTGCAINSGVSVNVTPSNPDSTSSSHGANSSSNGNIPTSSEEVEPPIEDQEGDVTINFYNVNDFHGHLLPDASNNYPGISALSYQLNSYKEASENYVFTNSGDMWQETYEAYKTKGALINDCILKMNCEAFGVGNHEFDWGIDVIKDAQTQLGDACPILGANVYYYDEVAHVVKEQASDIFKPYKIIHREGIDIGIIGVIGENQITSITSSNWQGLTFLEPSAIVKDISKDLKENQGCEMVIVLAHAPINSKYGGNLNDVFKNELTSKYNGVDRYIDGVFLGHSHQTELEMHHGVPFIQSRAHGEQISHFDLTYHTNGTVSCGVYENHYVNYRENETFDPAIDEVLNNYINGDYIAEANGVVGKVYNTGYSLNRNESGKMLAKISYLDIIEKFPQFKDELVLVGNNKGRSPVSLTEDYELTRNKAFEMLPFTNQTHIAYIKGADINNEFINHPDWNVCYMPNPNLIFDDNEYYLIGCIDYTLLHKNKYRNYDYFPSYTKSEAIYTTYGFDIVCNYLLKNGAYYF